MNKKKGIIKYIFLFITFFGGIDIPLLWVGVLEDNLLLLIDDILFLLFYPIGIVTIIKNIKKKYRYTPSIDKTRKRVMVAIVSVIVFIMIALAIYTNIVFKPVHGGYMSLKFALLKRRAVFIINLALIYLIGEERYSQ